MEIDPDRLCELCSGPLVKDNATGICRTTRKCRIEDGKRRGVEIPSCKICGGYLPGRVKSGICRATPKCRAEARKNDGIRQEKRAHRNLLLPEDGIIDEIAVHIAVHGIRKIAMTHRERVIATQQMLTRGLSLREMCDRLHVQPSVVRNILDELGFECVRNEHIAGSKIMVILPKDRARGSRRPDQRELPAGP